MTPGELEALIGGPPESDGLFALARRTCDKTYGRRVFVRGLVEYTSFCRRGCLYCGLRRQNAAQMRYRMTPDEIVAAVRHGFDLGFHSFVLQGGEDAFFSAELLCDLVRRIKESCPGCAVTLSAGELPEAELEALGRAGTDRYLLRHETADGEHYSFLHDDDPGGKSRKSCLYALKRLGFQTGAGFMVGSPGQTAAHLAADLVFLRELQPHMVGIGPFLPATGTPFAHHTPGSADLTLRMVALTRLLLPRAMLPATTAMNTLVSGGRTLALGAGANVVMPNLTPARYLGGYAIYDGKAVTGAESAEQLTALADSLARSGYEADFSRGDAVKEQKVLSL